MFSVHERKGQFRQTEHTHKRKIQNHHGKRVWHDIRKIITSSYCIRHGSAHGANACKVERNKRKAAPLQYFRNYGESASYEPMPFDFDHLSVYTVTEHTFCIVLYWMCNLCSTPNIHFRSFFLCRLLFIFELWWWVRSFVYLCVENY